MYFKYFTTVMLNLIQHLVLIYEIAGQARNNRLRGELCNVLNPLSGFNTFFQTCYQS